MDEVELLIFAKRTALLYDQEDIDRVYGEIMLQGLTINQGANEEELVWTE